MNAAPPEPPAEAAADPAGFADVLRMLERLPLSDAERAVAVRRLLDGKGAVTP